MPLTELLQKFLFLLNVPTNCLSVIGHFVGLALEGLNSLSSYLVAAKQNKSSNKTKMFQQNHLAHLVKPLNTKILITQN